MNENPTPEEVRASIVPKSDQLNADDLLTGPITVAVTAVRRGDKEQPIIVEIDGHRPYKPCKGMRRVLISAWSDDPKAWVGQRMTLYCDPDVKWASVKVGGIRISHLSGIGKDREFVLTVARGKRAPIKIQCLDAISPEDEAYIADAMSEISQAETPEMLKAIGFVLAKKSEAVREAVRPLYQERKAELEAGSSTDG